jgi:hypothetical protein
LCPATPATTVLTNAVCACESLKGIGAGLTTRSSANLSADVGLNRSAEVTGHWEVGGSLRAYEGVGGIGNIDARDDLVSFADLSTIGRVKVGRDLAVRKDVRQIGYMDVGGVMKIGGSRGVLGFVPTARFGSFDLADALPCACNGLDVKAEVAKAQTTASVKKMGDLSNIGAQRVVLTTGSYSLANFDQIGFSEIAVDGAASLYVSGDLRSIGHTRFSVPPGSTLDLYVSGNVSGIGATLFKEAPTPGAVRFYIGEGFQHIGWQDIPVSIYAPKADIDLIGGTVVRGSILARSIQSIGLIVVDYAKASFPPPNVCTPPGPNGGGTPGGSSGGGDGIN